MPETPSCGAIEAWARALGDLAPTARPLAGGTGRVPWLLGGPGGRFVLHAYRGESAVERATLALAAAGAACRQGLAAPRPVPTDAGGAFWQEGEGADAAVYTLSRWLPGRARRSWLRLGAADAEALGIALADLHAALRTLPPDIGGPGPAGVGIAHHGRPADQILHGDPSQGNILWRIGAPDGRVGFIDFEHAHRGFVELDLGRALVGMAPWAGAGSSDVFAAFLAGYAARGGRPSGPRLRRGLAVALDEGEAWLGRATLSDGQRAAARRWLTRARTVRLDETVLGRGARTARRPGGAVADVAEERRAALPFRRGGDD